MFSRERIRTALLTVIDISIMIFAYLFAFLLRFDFVITNHQYYFDAIIESMMIIIIIHIVVFAVLGVFKSLWKYVSIEEVLRLSLAISLSNTICFFIITFARNVIIPRTIYVMATLIIMVGCIGIRGGYRYLRLQKISFSRNNRALIIGAGDAGYLLAKEIASNREYECKVVGFIDDNAFKVGRMINSIPILGTTADLHKIVKKYDLSGAYIAMPSATKDEVKLILRKCHDQHLVTKIMGMQEFKHDGKENPVIREVSIDDLLGRGEVNLEQTEIASYLKDKTVLITGGGGSIGSELCRQIMLFEPELLICFDISENEMYDLQQEIIIKQRNGELTTQTNLKFLVGSVRDVECFSHVIKAYNPNIVFHAAAHKHVPLMEDSPKESIKNNIFGTLNVVKTCVEENVEKVILISSDKAVNPTNVMGASKRMCELIIQAYRNNGFTKLGAVRFGNVLGSNGSVIPLFKKQIESGGPITVTDREVTRYFMTIPEATQLVLQASAYADNGDIFVLDMGEPIKISKLAEDLIRLSGLRPYEDIKIQYIGLRPGEKMYEELSLGEEIRHKTKNNLIFINEPLNITMEELNEKMLIFEAILKSEESNKEISEKIVEAIK